MHSIGDYKVLIKIAEGGMAEVFLCKSSLSSSIDKYFAIKCLLSKYSSNKKFIDLFTNEARIQVNMNHGNVASVFDFGVRGGRFYIVMEHINGVNGRLFLRDLEEKLSEPEIVYMIREVARGLDHAHNCRNLKTGEKLNIIHGDISPENIMITTDGEVKVIDFGVSQKMEATDGITAGKKRYMSNAQASGLPLMARADIYSLSRTFLEHLRSLYGLENPLGFDEHKKDLNEIKEKLPKEIFKILTKGLGYGEESYQEMKQFSKELTRYLNINYPDFEKLDLGDKVMGLSGRHFTDIAQSIATNISLGDEEDDRTVVSSGGKGGKKIISRTRSRRIVTKGKKAS